MSYNTMCQSPIAVWQNNYKILRLRICHPCISWSAEFCGSSSRLDSTLWIGFRSVHLPRPSWISRLSGRCAPYSTEAQEDKPSHLRTLKTPTSICWHSIGQSRSHDQVQLPGPGKHTLPNTWPLCSVYTNLLGVWASPSHSPVRVFAFAVLTIYMAYTLVDLKVLAQLHLINEGFLERLPVLKVPHSSSLLKVYHHLTYLNNSPVHLFRLCASITMWVPWVWGFFVVYCYVPSTQNSA